MIELALTIAELCFAAWLYKQGHQFTGGTLFGATMALYIRRRLNNA